MTKPNFEMLAQYKWPDAVDKQDGTYHVDKEVGRAVFYIVGYLNQQLRSCFPSP